MTAKEMFEKLGYEAVENSNSRLIYGMKSTWNEITFWLIDKSYVLEYTELLTNELLQAINKQVEELGWLKGKVEIIEDTPKKDKKIEKLCAASNTNDYFIKFPDNGQLMDKINEIIDRLNGE